MNQQYFVLDFAHSIHGRVKRIQFSPRALYYLAGSIVLLAFVIFIAFSAYLRMSWKVANYNALRSDFEHLRDRYQELQRVSKQRTEQVATLQTLASEVSIAYGFNQSNPNAEALVAANPLDPSVQESIEEFNFLKSASYSHILHQYSKRWQVNTQPSLWPVNGVLRSSFGKRSDPFSGDGTFHTGVDLQASSGTPVHVTADGVVLRTEWGERYGRLLIVDHGNGVETWYAHLSKFSVLPGQEVRRGQVVALSGGTGRVTSPHLHYEVRLGGTPVNPYKYLAKSAITMPTQPAHSDLGF